MWARGKSSLGRNQGSWPDLPGPGERGMQPGMKQVVDADGAGERPHHLSVQGGLGLTLGDALVGGAEEGGGVETTGCWVCGAGGGVPHLRS